MTTPAKCIQSTSFSLGSERCTASTSFHSLTNRCLGSGWRLSFSPRETLRPFLSFTLWLVRVLWTHHCLGTIADSVLQPTGDPLLLIFALRYTRSRGMVAYSILWTLLSHGCCVIRLNYINMSHLSTKPQKKNNNVLLKIITRTTVYGCSAIVWKFLTYSCTAFLWKLLTYGCSVVSTDASDLRLLCSSNQ